MKPTNLAAMLSVVIAVGLLAADASAYYHPTMGRFLTRDPGAGNAKRVGTGGPVVPGGFIPRDPTGTNQYVDGMNLYQYVSGKPGKFTDPTGLLKKPYECCSNDQEKMIDADVAALQRSLPFLLDDINEALDSDQGQYPPFTAIKLGRARKVVQCMSNKTQSLGAKCEPKGASFMCNVKKSAAWVKWVFATRVHFCQKHFNYGTGHRVTVIAHELSHTCGAIDLGKVESMDDYPRGWTSWESMAATYHYWVGYGFCVPGYDCAKKAKPNGI